MAHDSLAVRRDTLGTRPGATAADTLGARPGAAAADTLGARPRATAADTTVRRPARRRPAFHFDLGGLIAHIGTIGTEATFSQNSAFTRVGGTPDFFYLFGLRPNPGGYGEGGRVTPLTGNTRTALRDLRLGAHTRIVLPFGVFLQTRADFETRGNEVNGLLTQQITHHYPYFDVDYGSLAKTIRLERFLLHPQLRTTFDRNLVYDYAAGSATVTGIARSTELRPLIGVTGELKNRTRVDLRIDTRNTTRENRLLGSSLDFDRSVDAKLDLSRQYSQGQKVAFLGKESTVRSSISLGLSTVYSRLNRGTVVNGNVQQPSLETRLSVSGTGSYGFSDNVNGNASIGYSQNHDLIRDLITRSLRVELRAQFTF